MITNLVLIAAAVAGVSLLWRVYRYDSENPLNVYLDKLPYLFRKPITCGMCVTFWISLCATILYTPLAGIVSSLPTRFPFMNAPVVGFVFEWMVLGTTAALFVYVIDTFYQVSHYYKHAAHSGS